MENAFGVLDELEEEVQGTSISTISKPKTSMYVDLFEGECPIVSIQLDAKRLRSSYRNVGYYLTL
jgi:hypothetical protein